jgi:hypothetical protein
LKKKKNEIVNKTLAGVLQERIMTTPYGQDETGPIYFEETTFLVLSNRVFAALVACAILIYRGMTRGRLREREGEMSKKI